MIWTSPVNSGRSDLMLTPQFLFTLGVLVAALLVIARMIVLEKRPRKDLNPRLIPTTPVMIAVKGVRRS